MSYKDLVVELFPHARCERFPKVWATPWARTWRVRLVRNGEIISRGNTAGQAWRRAYDKILLNPPGEGESEKE